MQKTWLMALGTLGFAACSGGSGNEDLQVVDGAVAGVALVTLPGADAGTAEVTFEDPSGEVLTTTAELPGDIVQLGLKAGGNYTVRATVTNDGDSETFDDVSFQAGPPPSNGPTFLQQSFDPSLACDPDGRYLVSWLGNSTGVAIIDRDGNYRWSVPSASDEEQVNRVRISRDGESLHWMFVDTDRIDDIGQIVTRPLDGGDATQTRALWGHHDFVEHPDQTTIGWLGFDFRDIAAADVVGLPSPWQGSDPLPTASDTIYETTIGTDGTAETTTVINLYDDYFPDHPIVYTTERNFRLGSFLPGYHELTHGNSLALVGDTYLAMLRWVDSVVGVNRTNGEIWTLGGVYNEFTPVDGQTVDDLFLQSHFSDAWQDTDGLHMLVFDNRPRPEPSRLSEYVLDIENRTFDRVWTYQDDSHEAVLGDVRRFGIEGCDNVLVSFSGSGRLVELTRDGQVAWEVATRSGAALSRVQYLPSFDDPAAAVYPAE
ncbi:MAG: aryl-sulfate sulfotransferase [Myxococcota bacterium]